VTGFQETVKKSFVPTPAPLPAFVGHLPKPVRISGLADVLVRTMQATAERASRRATLPLTSALPTSDRPEPTRREDSEQEVEVRAASDWQERSGQETADAKTRDVERKSEQHARERAAADPLLLARERNQGRESKGFAAWRARRSQQQAAGARTLSGTNQCSDSSASERATKESKSDDVTGPKTAPQNRRILVVEGLLSLCQCSFDCESDCCVCR
jgi:hypothetical protein